MNTKNEKAKHQKKERLSLATLILALAGIGQAIYASIDAPFLVSALWAAAGVSAIVEAFWFVMPSAKYQRTTTITVVSIALVFMYFWSSRSTIAIETANEPPYVEMDSYGDKWVRFKTTNLSDRAATCRATLTSLRPKEGKPIFSEPVLLWAAHHGDDGKQTNILYGDAPKYFNLLRLGPLTNYKFVVASPSAAHVPRVALSDGEYILDVQVAGERCGPVKTSISIKIERNNLTSLGLQMK